MLTTRKMCVLDALEQARATLLGISWETVDSGGGTSFSVCPMCGRTEIDGHRADCKWEYTLRLIAEALEALEQERSE